MIRVGLSLALAAFAGVVWAHGGLAMEQDMCKLTVGPYMMHFAGYQEDAQRTEFCEDIPHKGPTIIVLDAVDTALRDYVGLVYAGENRKHASVFPFSVGKPMGYVHYIAGLIALLMLAWAAYRLGRQRLQKDIALQGHREA